MTTYAYDANNRLLTETKTTSTKVGQKTYHYDPNGNQVGMTQELYSAGALSEALNLSLGVASGEIYRYNEFNQLVQTYNEAGMVSYAYNPAIVYEDVVSGNVSIRAAFKVNRSGKTIYKDAADIISDVCTGRDACF